MRIEPPVSVPMASGSRPLATATPHAEDEPPGARAGPVPFGLRGVP